MNFTINTNTPFTIAFDIKHLTPADQNETIKYQFLNQTKIINGTWLETQFDLPYYANGVIVKKIMKMRVFGTSLPAINEGMSYFGISPGPKSLAEFMFYH
jgi:hypothetical protein